MAIVGSDIEDNVLGPGDPLGKEIRVDGVPFTVIGVGQSQGKMFGQSMDNWVAIPLTTFLERYGSHEQPADLCGCGRRRRGDGGGERRVAHHHAHAAAPGAKRAGRFLHRFERDVSEYAGKHSRQLWRSGGGHRRHLAGDRRHRHHEHHAGDGDGADARDRRAQGAGRASAEIF